MIFFSSFFFNIISIIWNFVELLLLLTFELLVFGFWILNYSDIKINFINWLQFQSKMVNLKKKSPSRYLPLLLCRFFFITFYYISYALHEILVLQFFSFFILRSLHMVVYIYSILRYIQGSSYFIFYNYLTALSRNAGPTTTHPDFLKEISMPAIVLDTFENWQLMGGSKIGGQNPLQNKLHWGLLVD